MLWVDINAGAVHTGALDGERVTEDSVLELPETVGAVACARDGELLVAGARRLYRVSPDGAVSPGPQLIADDTASRLNDGGVRPGGTLSGRQPRPRRTALTPRSSCASMSRVTST